MLKFLHAADLHLDSPLLGLERYDGAPVDQIRGATRRALENLVHLAIEEHVAFLLIAGDVYDGPWKDFNTGLFFVAQMSRLQEAGIPVYLIAGNHDAENRMTRTLPLPENVHTFPTDCSATEILEDVGVAIHGRGFAKAAVSDDLSLTYPAAIPGVYNVGLLHTSATGREGHEPYAPCTIEGLKRKQFDYWALGHIHQRELLSAEDEPPVLFAGNLQGRHIRETGPKGCVLVTVDDRGRTQTEFRPLDVLRWEECAVDASGAEDLDEVRARFAACLRKTIGRCDGLPAAVRVEVSGACPAHSFLAGRPQTTVNELRAESLQVGGADVWVEKVRIRTQPGTATHAPYTEDGPQGELLQFARELRENDKLLQSLLQSDLGDVSDLKRKLPPELSEIGELRNLGDLDYLKEALQQAEGLLSMRLTGGSTDA